MDVFMEKGLCLERTKVGSDDKQHAYAVSRRQGACIAGSIFIAFLVCAAAIIEFKAEMLTSAVQEVSRRVANNNIVRKGRSRWRATSTQRR